MIESGLAAVAKIAWTICCMDGATFSVEVPEHACVAEIKRAIGAAREVPYFAMELFVKDQDKALDDALRMESASRPPLFMLMKVSSERLALVALFKSTGGGAGRGIGAGRSWGTTKITILKLCTAETRSMLRAG